MGFGVRWTWGFLDGWTWRRPLLLSEAQFLHLKKGADIMFPLGG